MNLTGHPCLKFSLADTIKLLPVLEPRQKPKKVTWYTLVLCGDNYYIWIDHSYSYLPLVKKGRSSLLENKSKWELLRYVPHSSGIRVFLGQSRNQNHP